MEGRGQLCRISPPSTFTWVTGHQACLASTYTCLTIYLIGSQIAFLLPGSCQFPTQILVLFLELSQGTTRGLLTWDSQVTPSWVSQCLSGMKILHALPVIFESEVAHIPVGHVPHHIPWAWIEGGQTPLYCPRWKSELWREGPLNILGLNSLIHYHLVNIETWLTLPNLSVPCFLILRMEMILMLRENRASGNVRSEKTVAIQHGKCIRSSTQGHMELAA